MFGDEVQVLVELHQASAGSARRRSHVGDEKSSAGQRQKVVGDARVGRPGRFQGPGVSGGGDVEEEGVVLAFQHAEKPTAGEDRLVGGRVAVMWLVSEVAGRWERHGPKDL